MKRMIIRIKIEDQVKVDKFEVPAEQPLCELIPHLVQGLGLDSRRSLTTYKYWLETETGLLDNQKSLAQLEIKNEALLYLKSGVTLPQPSAPGPKPFSGQFVVAEPKNESSVSRQ